MDEARTQMQVMGNLFNKNKTETTTKTTPKGKNRTAGRLGRTGHGKAGQGTARQGRTGQDRNRIHLG